ncbi:fluoride efflux transporter CrcB [Nocardia donostiensis]|uniref:Fluoride-specific ion channel FluC n=1 Tax=Nocardia donostiensis TaxID=1538463 RepID=A0A1V2TF69_9NOCA|nr:fluoride efflux transporter CrcB [Nocardia donostiensis]ONM48156.1 chromosome condensation protein CrcB [Nocardia donostiensis]OQS13854.1 chromosome condensation protein CrcB [Nocardia donostiensis]OQS20385.1 chromosome condensation protein CrcB [Nocardia donostiensis]
MTAAWVAAGGMLGAAARYLPDRTVSARWETKLPLGTLSVSIIGSALLGALIGTETNGLLLADAGTGFCGALTTFSTFGYETIRLAAEGAYVHAVSNIVLNVASCLAVVYTAAATTAGLAS